MSSLTFVDLENICRICLSENVTETTDLFCHDHVESIEILTKISTCFRITLDSEKYLPCVICKKCIDELNNAISFRIKCLTINERFREYRENLLKNKSIESVAGAGQEFANDSQSAFDSDAQCESHEAHHITTSEKNDFKCNMCNKVLKSMKSLEKHVVCMHEKRKHAGQVSGYGTARRYHCTTCSYSTPHSQTLVNHMRHHNGERPFRCECGKNFTQASSLAAHQKTHNPTSYFTCSECGKQFKHAFSLKTHLRVHNDGNFSCSICNKVLKSNQTLHAHMKRHYKVYNYNCENCGDTFVTSAELHNHRLKHSAEKNIKCHICDYTTNTRKSLVAHLKRHVGDKSFKCKFCDKSFYTQGDLRRHMRAHTREKPFSCQLCTQKFTYSTSLNKHMQTVHGIQYKWGDVKRKEARMKKLPLNVALAHVL